MHPTLTVLQDLLFWASSLSLIVMLFVTWRYLKMLGFLIVAIGSALNFLPGLIHTVMPLMRMGYESRAIEFTLIYSCYIGAGALIVVGSLMILLAWSNKNASGTSP